MTAVKGQLESKFPFEILKFQYYDHSCKILFSNKKCYKVGSEPDVALMRRSGFPGRGRGDETTAADSEQGNREP